MPKKIAQQIVKHVFTAMSHKCIATADVEPPLVVIFPDIADLDEGKSGLITRAEPGICKHAETLFGRKFESIAHIKSFCDELLTVEQVIAELRRGDRLLFDTSWGQRPDEQLREAIGRQECMIPGGDCSAGNVVLTSCVGRIPQALALTENAARLGGTVFINAETSWKYYGWSLEYNADHVSENDHQQETKHIIHALSTGHEQGLQWLGNVPPETILEIRRKGVAEEVRSILSLGINELIKIDPNNYIETAGQVVNNLDRAFAAHQRALQEAKQKKLRLYGIDVPQCMAIGGIAIAAALTSNPYLGAVSGVLGIAGLPSIKDIKSKFTEIAEADRARRVSPTGILFNHLPS